MLPVVVAVDCGNIMGRLGQASMKRQCRKFRNDATSLCARALPRHHQRYFERLRTAISTTVSASAVLSAVSASSVSRCLRISCLDFMRPRLVYLGNSALSSSAFASEPSSELSSEAGVSPSSFRRRRRPPRRPRRADAWFTFLTVFTVSGRCIGLFSGFFRIFCHCFFVALLLCFIVRRRRLRLVGCARHRPAPPDRPPSEWFLRFQSGRAG